MKARCNRDTAGNDMLLKDMVNQAAAYMLCKFENGFECNCQN
jgi:hypothetical protein